MAAKKRPAEEQVPEIDEVGSRFRSSQMIFFYVVDLVQNGHGSESGCDGVV